MTLKVRSTVRSAIGFAARKGWIVGNPMKETELDGVDREDDEVVIPEKADVAAILAKAAEIAPTDKGRALTMVSTGFFSGARPSELLAIERPALTTVGKDTSIRISQALDKRGRIGLPKRKASHRTVPIGPHLAGVLKRWVATGLAGIAQGEQVERDGSKRTLQTLFPNEVSKPVSYHNFYHRIWGPLLIAAGITIEGKNEKGEPTQFPKYPPNVMRHFAASLWIEQGVNMKRLQKRMGHASIQTTMNTYGHLFRNADRDQEEAAAAETVVLSLTRKDDSA
jgi:integrase